jgi:catechol 2,3-dioxygenase-like lactoylglutathione lyase family enzyme
MFDHVGLRVKDLDAAVRLYTAMLAPLGHVPGSADGTYAAFGPKAKPALWLHKDAAAGGAHVAFQAPDRKAVDEFHRQGLKAGAKDNGKPGLRTDYAPNYYGAFLIDLDSNNVEAVCMV